MCNVCVCMCVYVCVCICVLVCVCLCVTCRWHPTLWTASSTTYVASGQICVNSFFLRPLTSNSDHTAPPRQTQDYNKKQTNMVVHCPTKSGRICQDPGLLSEGTLVRLAPRKKSESHQRRWVIWQWELGSRTILRELSLFVFGWKHPASCSGLVQRQHRDEF